MKYLKHTMGLLGALITALTWCIAFYKAIDFFIKPEHFEIVIPTSFIIFYFGILAIVVCYIFLFYNDESK